MKRDDRRVRALLRTAEGIPTEKTIGAGTNSDNIVAFMPRKEKTADSAQ